MQFLDDDFKATKTYLALFENLKILKQKVRFLVPDRSLEWLSPSPD